MNNAIEPIEWVDMIRSGDEVISIPKSWEGAASVVIRNRDGRPACFLNGSEVPCRSRKVAQIPADPAKIADFLWEMKKAGWFVDLALHGLAG